MVADDVATSVRPSISAVSSSKTRKSTPKSNSASLAE